MEVVLILGAVFVVVFLFVGGSMMQGAAKVEGSYAEKDTARALGKKPQDSTGAVLGCSLVVAMIVVAVVLAMANGAFSGPEKCYTPSGLQVPCN